jgi:cation diffusion facilitator family transporter
VIPGLLPVDYPHGVHNLAPMPPLGPPAPDRATRVRRVLVAILLANVAVLAARLLIGIVSGSLAILGGALDAAVDMLNNVLALAVVRVASKAPDEDHPYGHGKFETLGALAIVGFLSITCFELARGGVHQLLAGPHPVAVTDVQLALLATTMGVNVCVAWIEHRAGTALGSELLTADAAHTRADVFITVGILGGVLFARQGVWWVDPAIAIGVALAIVHIAYRIVVRTVPVLVDQQAVPTSSIQEAAQSVAGVKGAYGIRSRGPTDLRYAEVTIAVDRHADVETAHAIADQVEGRLKRDLQLHEVTVHIEPC